jgi:hypothetical protein
MGSSARKTCQWHVFSEERVEDPRNEAAKQRVSLRREPATTPRIASAPGVAVSTRALAEARDRHTGNTELFLNAVASLGYLRKKEDVFSNTPVADRYLVRGKPDFIGDYLVASYHADLSEDVDLAELVRNGPGSATAPTMDTVSFEAMAEMMRTMQTGARSTEMVRMLRGVPEFEGAGTLLDLGCGTGIIGIAAVRAHPTMRGVLFDVPAMEGAIRDSIRAQEVEDRVRFMGGDFLADDIGSGYDIVLVVGTLNFAKQALVPLMEKVRGALNEGGVVLCVGDGIHSEGTRPKDMLATWLASGLRGMDYRMPRGMVADAALKAGFRNVRTLAGVATSMGQMDIDILRG